MVPVAIVTGGHIRGDIRFAQRHGFAVVGVTVMGKPVLVTTATPLVARHFEVAVFWGFHLVRGVQTGARLSPWPSKRPWTLWL